MTLDRGARIFVKLISAFLLIWSFLMPTIETVVTPVSSAIPAVSSGAPGCTGAAVLGQNYDKPESDVPYAAFSVTLLALGLALSVRMPHFSFVIPLLMKSLLLRPIKFTSNYLSV
ncbi:MAG: hypothetical protein K0Q94_429 [Paenibacillus sp.]|jgi:hypothetical protein|uniref:hypothetical protein n=1 Tax=unclassified Paenibacillus TaxID=185978 RepID=UPI0029F36F10|nr:hypothetical protein [Paenibacillus sp.]